MQYNRFSKLKLCFAFSLIFANQASWAVDVFSKPAFSKCKEELQSFILGHSQVGLQRLTGHDWQPMFVGEKPVLTKYILSQAGSSIELLAKGKEIYISSFLGGRGTMWVLNTDDCKTEQYAVFEDEVETVSTGDRTFTDRDLTELLKNKASGAIYYWSPHMSLSLSSISEIEKVCQKWKIPLTILLDKDAEPVDVEEARKKFGIKSEYLITNSSNDLLIKSARLHFPNLQLYKDGELLQGNLSGAKNTTDYKNYIIQSFGR